MTAREAALSVLERWRRDGAWPGLVMDQMFADGGLSGRDASLAARLSLGVIQNCRYLDYTVRLFCHAKKIEPKLLDILRLGAYQILFLDRIPRRAAVSESVSLCSKCGLARASGLVNAVLRRLSEQADALPELPGKGSAGYLALRYSQSDWFVERLISQHGYDFTESFLAACQQEPYTDLQLNPLKRDPESVRELLVSSGADLTVPSFPKYCISVLGGTLHDLPGFSEGYYYVQDRAAAMAVEIAEPRPGIKVLDACSAPGGKSFAAAIRMQNCGSIISCDIHEKKLSLIQSGAERLGITCIHPMAQDARQPRNEWKDAFDLVIADVPCSGFGVLRKKPEIRYKDPDTMSRLPALQAEILNNLASCVKPGGTLLYSTCTVFREENEEQVERFLRSRTNYKPIDFEVEGRRSANGCYTFWPHIDGTDGFFVSRLKRLS